MPTGTATRVLVSPDAGTRLQAALDWLAAHPADAEVMLVAPTWESADELARRLVADKGARFGLVRLTLDRLAAILAATQLAERRLVPASWLSFNAVVARAVHALHGQGNLSYFGPVADRPGFPPAMARTLQELRMNDVAAESYRDATPASHDVALLADKLEQELADAGLADRATIYRAAIQAARAKGSGCPLLVLDVPLEARLEADLITSLAADSVLVTVAAGDQRAQQLLGMQTQEDARLPATSLGCLKQHLFADTAPRLAPLDETVSLSSWPGEARECIEIARSIQQQAAVGTPYDRMAVFLHAPQLYSPHLEEALGRAGIPAFFAAGSARPHPAGRAFLALLACAAERLSASRFAEYLSLGQVPALQGSSEDSWRPPQHDLAPSVAAAEPPRPEPPLPLLADPDAAAVLAGTLRAPWRWEQLLVEAAVIGSYDRWERRLRGLEAETRLKRAESEDDARVASLDRILADLAHLQAFALPLLQRLAGLPNRATWGDWLPHLRHIAAAALRQPSSVLEVLAELEPMGPVGPLQLSEVQLVLAPRLRDMSAPPPRRRYGAVFVAPTEHARGLSFDVVFVPGLVEKMFPGQIVEDPILLDAARQGLPLLLQQDRVNDERLSLRLAVGSANQKVFLSYPRLDVEQARARVPSFYALEALRAAEGELPGFDQLHTRLGESRQRARLGWPAPQDAKQAVDEAEYDLALLAPLLNMDAREVEGTARYLLTANPHLGRSLRQRGRRWWPKWLAADGLVSPDDLARAALEAHGFDRRSYSPTALQNFSECPYKFFLQAIHRLQPLEEAEGLEQIDPLTRGSMFHEVQCALLTRLQTQGLLPITDLEHAQNALDGILHEVAEKFKERLAPAIERVWEDGIQSMRADLREWLRRVAGQAEWVPHRFELSFGLASGDREQADSHSVAQPIPISAGLQLRGSIDLVELHHGGGRLRATDHKTGKVRGKRDMIVDGGKLLQPILYALACEKLFEETVEAGRLYYCTADGGYEERVVYLDARARQVAEEVVSTIGERIEEGFLPAAPGQDACKYCDYRPVCGPHEALRTQHKPELPWLQQLRELP